MSGVCGGVRQRDPVRELAIKCLLRRVGFWRSSPDACSRRRAAACSAACHRTKSDDGAPVGSSSAPAVVVVDRTAVVVVDRTAVVVVHTDQPEPPEGPVALEVVVWLMEEADWLGSRRRA